jgi:UDP-N-acetylglucosamine 2-epimerase (non-hydrolysing)/GDP/UDP-N,N'-diacetylbacillosamine 2-epimerase (hydrolysing)
VALALRIPIAHLEGGEISEGAIDDAVRNALTKMSHIHFTATENSRLRVLAMGEESWRVHRVGAPSIDHLRRQQRVGREQLEAELGVKLNPPTVVVSYHPVTLARETTVEAAALFSALERIPQQIVFCFPNADAGSRALIQRARAFCGQNARAHLFVNLENLKYWSLLASVDLLLGNSSGGIMETATLGLPTVNVGIRQRGRERPRNVLDAAAETGAILEAMARALSPAFRASLSSLTNPYGDGHAAERMVEVLSTLPPVEELLLKRAVALENAWCAR